MVACGTVQGFATSLLDVADNLGRAVESVRKSANADDDEVNQKVLQSLLEGVEMTDKQLMQVFLCPLVLRPVYCNA
jgi:molecular chaperone GrpE